MKEMRGIHKFTWRMPSAARCAALAVALGITTVAQAVTKPLAVWNGDFYDATTRNGVALTAGTGNTTVAASVTIGASSTGAAFVLPTTYRYTAAVFTVSGLENAAEGDILVSLGAGSSPNLVGVYVKSVDSDTGTITLGGIANGAKWTTRDFDGSMANTSGERTFVVTYDCGNSDGSGGDGLHLYEITTGSAVVVYGSANSNGLRYATNMCDTLAIGGGKSTYGSNTSLVSFENLVLTKVAVYTSTTALPISSATAASCTIPKSAVLTASANTISALNTVAEADTANNYFVNVPTATAVLPVADATAASNLVFPYDTTITVAGTTLTITGGMPVKLGSSITAVTGSGTVVAVGGTEIKALPSGAFSSDAWTGTVWLKGRTGWSDINPTAYGNAGSTLRFSGVQGYFAKKQCTLANTPIIELENDSYTYALNLNNGYSFNSNGGWSYVHTSELKGSGILQCDGSGGALIVVSSKWSDFTGSLKMANKTIWFGYETAPASNTDYTPGTVAGGIRIASGCKFTLPGDMTNWNVAGGYFGPGTIEISSHNSSSDVPVYLIGTDAETTIVLKGLTGTHHVLPFDNHTIAATVQLDGAVTINSGSTGRTYTFSKLTGSGNFANTFNEYFVFNDVSEYTGVLSCNKDSYKITAGLPTAPAVGDLIAKVDSTNDKVSTSVYYDGLSGGLSGELTAVNGVYGLYATAAATIGETSYPTFAAALAAAEEGDTITLSRTINETSVSVDKDLTLAVANNNVYLHLDSIAISEGKTLTFSAFNKAITVGAITGGGNIVSTGSNTLNFKFSGGTYEMASITTAKGLQFQGYGDVTVSGDVTVNGNFTLVPDAANTTSIDNGYTLKVTADSVDAETLNGGGTIATTDGTTVAGGTFYGKITGGLTASGNFVTQNSGAIDTLVIADGKTVTVGNRLASMSNIRFALDATDSTTYTDDGDGNITAFKGRGDSTYSLESGATAAVLNAGDATHFGGKPYVQFSSSKYARGSKVSARSYIAVVHPDAAGGYIAYYNSSQDRFGPSSTSWYARCYNGNIDSYLFQNGTSDRAFTADADTIVSLCTRITASDNREDHIGTDFVGAVGELVGFTSAISIEDRTSCEMYLMDKWNLAAAANFRPLPATAEVALQDGSTFDLGGYAQTVKSLSGSGTVQNGTLTVKDAINLSAGEVLTLPNTAEFTPGTVAAKIEDTTAGTVTLCGSLADAISAYSTGTLTILQSLTDVNLGTTETSITGIVLADGVSAPTFAANPPYSASYADGTIANARVASTYVWTPADASTDWTSLSNWRIGGVAPATLPGSSDTVEFPTSNAEGFTGWTVVLDSMPMVGAVVVNGDTAFSGARIQVKNGETSAVTGTGTITLGDNAGFYPGGENDLSLTVENNLKITASENAPAKVQGRVVKSSSGGATVRVNGNLTGTGWVEFGGTRSLTYLNGDNTEFAGHATFPDDAATAGARRLNVYFEDTSAVSSNAVWTIYNNNDSPLSQSGTQYCYRFGALFGVFKNTLASSRAASWIELGGANVNFDVVFNGVNHDDREDKIRKVGTGTMTLNAGSSRISELVLNGGSIVVMAGVADTVTSDVTTEVAGYEVVSTPNYENETLVSTTYTLNQTGIVPGSTSATEYPTKEAAETAAASYSIVLTSAQEAQELKTNYYKKEVYESDGSWYVRVVLDEDVVGVDLGEEATAAVSDSAVTITVTNLKPGLCYRIVSGSSADGMTTVGAWSDYYNGSNAPTLSADLPTSGVMFYSVEASDTK